MITLTGRLQPVFENTKTVCFGRFLVDVPALTIVAWGDADIPLKIAMFPNDVEHTIGLAKNFSEKLKNEKAIYHDHVPLLISVEDTGEPEGKIVTGYDGFEAVNDLVINGYFNVANDGVLIASRPLRDEKDSTTELIKSMAKRVRRLTEAEMPREPGNCIEHAFIADKTGPIQDPDAELIRIGFRLKEFPDTHLSILLTPSNPDYSEINSLEWQLKRLESDLKAENPNHPRLQTKYLRRGARQIHDWNDGFEALSVTPQLPGEPSTHDFAMDFRGVPSDPLKPYADIRMETGVVNNVAGVAKTSLTDEEALAIWDKITSTIRVRPTTSTAVKTADASAPRFPLGELAATGRTCPQTGWWQASESGNLGESGRQHIMAGERMPPVMSPGDASFWQKLKGERPTCRTGTVWKLVSYDDAPIAPTSAAKQGTTVTQAEGADLATDNGAPGKNESTSPDKKG
jgi:hypothetical protein